MQALTALLFLHRATIRQVQSVLARLMITAYIFLQAQVKVPNHGEIEKTQTQGRHEPIVSVEDFDKVQQMLNAKRKTLKNLNT